MKSTLRALLSSTYYRFIETQQMRMSSNYEGLALLAILGLLCGVFAGGIIVLFRLFMEFGANQILPFGDIEGFEGIAKANRFWLCVIGGLIVGILLNLLHKSNRSVGVVHVIERLDYHQGYLPFKNAVVQFFAGAISLLSGHSVGREGPSVHLGAAAGSGLGRVLKVPNNGIRILVGSGVAAAISAAFNTPLAGVIFAMEVVIMEYSVVGFTPIIVAAVSATTLTRLTLGDDTAFSIPPFEINTIHEIPIVIFMGGIIGCLSALFIQTAIFATRVLKQRAIWVRTLTAGVFTGSVAILLPQIMGTGYDTVNHLLLAQIGLAGVILLTIAKTMTTAAAIGLGIPAGLIGPTLFIGAAAGSAIGLVSASFFPGIAGPGYYAMLGMAAMMAATLQAPLAALVYLLELSSTQEVILPGMVAVISASLTTRVVFKKTSIYQHLMVARGLDYLNTPMSIALRKIGVAGIMDKDFVQLPRTITKTEALELVAAPPSWILLNDDENRRPHCVLPLSDLARHLNEMEQLHNEDTAGIEQDEKIDLFDIPAKRVDACPIEIVASLQEAHEKLQANHSELLFITGAHGATRERVYGVIGHSHIEQAYFQARS